MKSKLYIITTILSTFISTTIFAQATGLNIYQPSFSGQQAGWSVNGNASFGTINSTTALILNPSTGNQMGTAFWKKQISLSNNASFSVFFTFQIDQNNSRADGLAFILQQQSSTTTAATGGGLGYSGFPGKSIAVEFDTYQNGGDPNNNHIGLDFNGNTDHSTNGGVVASLNASTLDLADAKLKYVWIDYNGATNLFEVRISKSNTRPSTATISTTSYNLSNYFTGSSVYMGFSAATGGAWERHSITSFYAINKYQPINPATNTYAQNAMGIAMSSSTNNLSNNGTSVPVTITLTDAGGTVLANQPITLSILSGTGTLSTYSGTTNASGQLVVNISSTTAGTLTVNSVAGYGGISTNKTFTVNNTLPILVRDFTASIQNANVLLSWDIESVQNGKNIEVLRSSDGVNFSTIGTIEINNQATMLGAASYTDETPLSGMSYYRLRLNNLDAVSTYSPIAMVDFSSNNTALKILGNPVSNALKIIGLSKEAGQAMVFNIAGRVVAQTWIGTGSGAMEISCSNLPVGQYFVQIVQGHSAKTIPFVKM
ncbi:MAG: Ig-like domain-containing protein [Bacteroidetes bacterium]|nr:Ig-like domain-containing protein [Bacteroidota bacterium]